MSGKQIYSNSKLKTKPNKNDKNPISQPLHIKQGVQLLQLF